MSDTPEVPSALAGDHGETLEKPTSKNGGDVSYVERTLSAKMSKKDHMDYDRVDAEVAKYTLEVKIDISDEESDRLGRMIDKRVLVIMICTYFLQALDKGTLSFASIMCI